MKKPIPLGNVADNLVNLIYELGQLPGIVVVESQSHDLDPWHVIFETHPPWDGVGIVLGAIMFVGGMRIKMMQKRTGCLICVLEGYDMEPDQVAEVLRTLPDARNVPARAG